MKLNQFLAIAKKEGYANKRRKARTLKDSSKIFRYKEKEYEYIDRYFGYNLFLGEEIVLKNNKVIWGMNYYGKIINNKVNEVEIYSFLKESLRKIDENNPFRGPENYKKYKFEYKNKFKGNFSYFQGKEKIYYNKKKVYELVYQGGTIKYKS